jgi:UDP-glucose 4-epimerase
VRAIVTGGAGFIGSNLVDALLARGDEVHVLDDLSKGRRENVAALAQLHVADIREPEEVFDAVRPQLVFHLAAQADVRVSVEQPALDADVNILGTIRILEAARRHNAKVVFSSSGGAGYGECDGPAPETAVRDLEGLRRGVPRHLEPPVWDHARLAPPRQRVRAAAGVLRRGGRGRDLHGPAP